MYIEVDLRTGRRRLVEADDFNRFHLEADGDRHDVLRVLGSESRLGRTHHLWWSIEAVTAAGAGGPGAGLGTSDSTP